MKEVLEYIKEKQKWLMVPNSATLLWLYMPRRAPIFIMDLHRDTERMTGYKMIMVGTSLVMWVDLTPKDKTVTVRVPLDVISHFIGAGGKNIEQLAKDISDHCGVRHLVKINIKPTVPSRMISDNDSLPVIGTEIYAVDIKGRGFDIVDRLTMKDEYIGVFITRKKDKYITTIYFRDRYSLSSEIKKRYNVTDDDVYHYQVINKEDPWIV